MSNKRKWLLIQKMKIVIARIERNVVVRNVDDPPVLPAEGTEVL
jgi:hypothetical protein